MEQETTAGKGEEMEQEVQRSYWIDAAKLVAILGVLVDHTQNVLYSNHRIADCSYYSVGLFIFLMGVTGYGSYSRYRGSIPEKLKKNFWKIARPYLVATFIFSIAQDGQFTFLAFWKRLLYFNASAPFYYVALYLQLMAIIPVFAALLRMTSTKKDGIFIEMLVFGATVILSVWTTNHSNILDIYGGGGRLLGGSYLILCYLGMLFGKYRSRISVKPPVAILAWIAGICITLEWGLDMAGRSYWLERYLPIGDGRNPPGFGLGLYAVFMAITLYFMEKALSFSPGLTRAFRLVSALGKHTLYIFLYHRLFLDFLLQPFFPQSNIWLMRLGYFASMIGGSMAIEWLCKQLPLRVKKVYSLHRTS